MARDTNSLQEMMKNGMELLGHLFDTKADKWVDVKIPLTQLKPTKFAKTVVLSKGFDSKSLSAIQLTLNLNTWRLESFIRGGSIELEVESITTF